MSEQPTDPVQFWLKFFLFCLFLIIAFLGLMALIYYVQYAFGQILGLLPRVITEKDFHIVLWELGTWGARCIGLMATVSVIGFLAHVGMRNILDYFRR